jgi:hypothetical protein
MKKETRIVNEKLGVVQITTLDERWYQVGKEYYPSVSWIAGCYPKGVQFYKWLASKGWNEAEAIKNEAGERGSNVHNAIDRLNNGEEIDHELYSSEEWTAIMSYVDWYNEYQPKIIFSEKTVLSDKYKYAGTIDLFIETCEGFCVVDIKTSQSVWKEYELQLSAYRKALEDEHGNTGYQQAILQVGYRMNKKKYKFTKIDDKFDLFLSAQNIWEEEHGGSKPKQIDLPTKLKLINQ